MSTCPVSTRKNPPSGFSLIITISMMVLLSLLAVGLLGLSTVSLRSSRAGNAMAEARSNARLALMLAIGDLQKSLGPDQRVSARSSVVNGTTGEPNTLGAWQSWRWDPNNGGSPDYGEKNNRFLRWLSSTTAVKDALDAKLPTAAFKDAVWLVNPGTTGTPTSGDDVGPGLRASRVAVDIENHVGGYAWAVMDEAQKAPISLPRDTDPLKGEIVAHRTAPMTAGPETLLDKLAPDKLGNPKKLVSLSSAVVAAGPGSEAEVLGRQQALTTGSVGLLTNVAEGGLRTDLTTLFESNVDLATALGNTSPYLSTTAGAPAWDYLRNHYLLHKRVQNSTAGQPSVQLTDDLEPARRNPVGIDPAPTTERLLPVIAKLQIMFSVVTHNSHIGDRIGFFNQYGGQVVYNRQRYTGNPGYGCPHLVYDPVVTLWNPYDVELSFEKLRVRIYDPPVLFGFTKGINGGATDYWLRPEHANGEYHSLTRFQIAYERNTNAPAKTFTLLLREAGRGRGGVSGPPGGIIKLQPGEVKVFSPYIEPNWTWGLETAGGYSVRAFFDWNAGNDFGNIDGRSTFNTGRPTYGSLGVQAVPGWDPRAGLQTDHLSYASRPLNTRYDFEIAQNYNGGWLGIKLSDTLGVHAKPGRRSGASASDPDFKVDILAGKNTAPEQDMLRSYQFRFQNVASEVGSSIGGGRRGGGEIEREFLVGDLLQLPDDAGPGGKSPFAILTMSAKTTLDPSDVSQPWIFNHPVHEGGEQDTRYVGNALDTYDLRLEEVADFNTFPGVELDPLSNRGFFGASSTANRGVSNVPMFHVPAIPASSLGDLVTSNLVAGASLPRVTHALGNSHAQPLLPSDAVLANAKIRGTSVRMGRMLDHSYLLNDAMWDRYFFSTLAGYQNLLAGNESRGNLFKAFLAGERRLLNPRMVPMAGGVGAAQEIASELDGLSPEVLSRRMASIMGVQGAFNVNCDSVDAWRALIASMREAAILGWGNGSLKVSDKTGFPRFSFPLAGDPESGDSSGSIDVEGARRWAGFRALTDEQIKLLAESIVEQIRERGKTDSSPSLTIGEFVNRRLGSASGLHVERGLLQTAIEETDVNKDFHAIDSKNVTAASASATATKGIENQDAFAGSTGEGAPSILTQGDLMMALAPIVSVRGDTFRIRAYGESRDRNNKVQAAAWCEAVVQRLPEYLDPSDQPEVLPGALKSETNKAFGRRYVLTAFRWLSPEEV